MKTYTILKNFRQFLNTGLLLFMALTAAAQTAPPSVNITLTITPPYSSYYSDYSGANASKVLLLLQNNSGTQLSLKLVGQLTGDNGIRIATKANYVPSSPIVLNPREVKQLNGLALKDIFDFNTLDVTGIDKARLAYSSRLPEGNYNFCIQAADAQTGALLSAAAPLGCTGINILYPDAPILVSPAPNASTLATVPATLNFNWINAGYVPPVLQYILQVAEMPMTATDPNQVMNAASFPLINKTLSFTSYNLLPSDPPLMNGKRYAWRVKAVDPTGKTVFKNDGVSQAQSFRYGEVEVVASQFSLTKPLENIRIEQSNDLRFSWTFTDNSRQNNSTGTALPRSNTVGASTSKYQLYLKRVKNDKEIDAEKAGAKVSGRAGRVSELENGIVVEIDKDYAEAKSTPAIAGYIKDENTYEWYMRHPATGTESVHRRFTYQTKKAAADYAVQLSGRIKYRFVQDQVNYLGKSAQKSKYPNSSVTFTPGESGYSLGNKQVQVFRVTLMAPVFKVKKSVEVTENGEKKIYTEEVDSVATVSDLGKYPEGQISISALVPLADVMTDSMGNFKVNVPIAKNRFQIYNSNIKSVNTNQRYALVEGLVVRVNDGRFTDPNWFVFPTPGKGNILLEEQAVQIHEYGLDVKFSTQAQRNYKGTLYVLKDEPNRVTGEGQGLAGGTKDVLNITKPLYSFPGSPQYHYSHSKYSVVSYTKIAGMSNPAGELNQAFSKLVASNNGNIDNYTVYFEPDASQDALYFGPQKVSNSNLKKAPYTSTFFKPMNERKSLVFGPKYLTMKLSGRYVYDWKFPGKKSNARLPLPEGTKLLLVKGYISTKSFIEDKGSEIKGENLVATTTVGKNGEFKFDLGMLNYSAFNNDAGKSLIVLVDDPFYSSEPRQITYNESEDVQLGELTAKVHQFSFTSRLMYKDKETLKPANQMDVYLCRIKGQKPATAPANEGDPDNKSFFKTEYIHTDGKTYTIIDKAQTGEKGEFSFDRLALPSKSYTDEYFILAEPQSTSNDNYVTEEAFPLTGVMKFASIITLGNFGQELFSDAVTLRNVQYNKNQFQYVTVVAQKPYIEGAVYPHSNTSTSAIAGVLVELFDISVGQISPTASDEDFEKFLAGKMLAEPATVTGANGRFRFENFYKTTMSNKGKLLRFTKSGFLPTYKVIYDGKPLPKGQRFVDKFYLQLPLSVVGRVVNQKGENIAARVIVGNDFSWADTKWILGKPNNLWVSSLKGKVKFTVIPTDKVTYRTTVIEKTVSANNLDIGTLMVDENRHNLVVKCVDKFTGKYLNADIEVTNIKEKAGVEKYVTPNGVVIAVDFKSAGTLFDIRVVPQGNFTVGKTKVNSDMTKIVEAIVYVEKAVTFTCTATSGTGPAKQLLTDVSVSLKDFDEDEYVVTETKSPVGFKISKLPYNRWVEIGVTKKGYIGSLQKAMTNSDRTLTFSLTHAPDLMVNSIYGFPVELFSMGKLMSADTYLISGRLNPKGKVSASKLAPAKASDWLRFSDVKVKIEKTTGQLSTNLVSVLAPVVFDENELQAVLYDKYKLRILDPQGLRINASGTTGSIGGYVALDPASLSAGLQTSTSGGSGENNYLYLNKQGTDYAASGTVTLYGPTKSNYLETFTTSKSDFDGTPLVVSTQSQKKPSFEVVDGFKLTPLEKVVLQNNGMRFKTEIATNLAYIDKKNIAARGTMVIDDKGFDITEQENLDVTLNKWVLEMGKGWSLNPSGFSAKGNLNALGLTIPFSNLKMTYSKIGFGNFNVASLKLLNAWPVTLNATDLLTSFGFDKGYSATKGAWSVSILAKAGNGALASLTGLPDLGANDNILVSNINLYDTGNEADTRIQLVEDQTVTLNSIAKYRPYMVFGGKGFIAFRGGLNLDVPNLSGLGNVTYDLKYRVKDGKFTHVHETKFANLLLDARGIKVKFDTLGQVFTNKQLRLTGTLTDKDASGTYVIPVELVKNPDSTTMKLAPGADRIYLNEKEKNGSYLAKPYARMKISNGAWENMQFGGNLTGSEGIAPESARMAFTVKGDIVADNSAIGVQNMDAGGMKGINLTYDFKEKALMGSASLSQSTSFADISMDLNLRIGSDKWYIFSNGVANNIKNTPFNQAAMGMMIGNASLNGDQLASLHKHFKNNDIPSTFNQEFSSVRGMLMVMSADLPIPIIPTFDIDLDPVAHAELKHGIYGNLYYNFKFSTSSVADLKLSVGGRLGAFVKLGVGASIGLACASIGLEADAHADCFGHLAPFANAGERFLLGIGLKFTLKGQAYVGAGICDSDCETPCVSAGLFDVCSPIPCVKKGLNKTLVLGLEASVSDASPHFHFKSFKETN